MADRLSANTDYDPLELQDMWFDAYRGRSKWLDERYITVAGVWQHRKRLTLGTAKVSSAELANLLFSETPQITTDDVVMEILRQNKFIKNSKNLTEYIAALGGGAYKLRSDGEHIIIDYVKAYNFVPVSWDNSRILEADFISEKVIKNKTYKVVEKHRKLYKNLPLQAEDGTMILEDGIPVLSDERVFVGYSITTEMYDNEHKVDLPYDMQEYQEINIDRPLFAYIKTSLANNFNPDSPVGISYFSNAMDTLQALDIAFDSLHSELELGQKRIIVPTTALRTAVDPETGKMSRYFDPRDRVFMALKTDDDKTLDIHDNSVELRVTEIKEAIQTLLDIFCMQVGFSSGYLAFSSGGIKTATEVISNNSKTFKTKSAFENEVAEGMVDIMDSIRSLLIASGSTLGDDEYSVTFNDSVIEDRNSKQEYWASMVANGFASKTDAIMKIWGISEEEAQKKLSAIEAETPTPINFGE